MKIFGIPYTPRQLYSIIGDAIVAVIAIYLAYLLRFGTDNTEPASWNLLQMEPAAALFFISANLLSFFVADAYNPLLDFRRMPQMLRLSLATAVALLLQVMIYFVFPEHWWGRGVAGLSSLCFAALVLPWRAGLSWARPNVAFRSRTLIVSDGDAEFMMANAITQNREHRQLYQLVGTVTYPRFGQRRQGDNWSEPPRPEGSLPVLGTMDHLSDLAGQHRADLIIVAIRGSLNSNLAKQLLECKAKGVRIEEMPTIYKQITGKVPILHLSDSWLIFGPVFSGSSRMGNALQRIADVLCALLGLVLSAPWIALACVAIKLESKGPAFFLQERLGLNEQPFSIIKLRTMRQDAEAGTGAVWSKGAGDPRITRVGKFLRRTRIDELPQFWNVLRGDMSIVGPRPEREFFVRQLKEQIPFYALRFAVKPGVTGWAQVSFRYGASVDDAAEKLCYELFAIQEMSPVLYVLILLKTVQTMLFKPGS